MSLYSARLADLREALLKAGLDGFLVPLTDEHQSEYVGDYAQRLGWLTGFDGSAGTAVVLAERAAIFTDGRYTLQVPLQVSAADWDYVQIPGTCVADWLAKAAPARARIGYDPWLHTRGEIEEIAAALDSRQGILVATDGNPIDGLWTDGPSPSASAIEVYDDAFSGQSAADKRAFVTKWLAAHGIDAVVITALESIAWFLNIRGTDVAHVPVVLAYVIAHADGTTEFFVRPGKVDEKTRRHLGDTVRISDRADFLPALERLAGKRVAADPARTTAAIISALEHGGATIISERDPVVLAKAKKNVTEIAHHRAASIRDGAALARFLRWIEAAAPTGSETELSASAKLLEFRRATNLLRDTSFDTISAVGPNSAVPHYRVTESSSAPILPGQIYLVDSGAQYLGATTDVTRVVPIGPAMPEWRDRFTRVLKAHIAIATAVFPDGTLGCQIDAFARRPLWEAGLDYAHGTGHGVGSYLAVHEGPQRIADPRYPGGQSLEPLRAGMLLSNEPGYYKAGEFGIRIENLVLIEPRGIAGAEGDMLGFETLTLCPIERDLIDAKLLTPAERFWLDAYHARVLEALSPEMSEDERLWLEAKCRPLQIADA